MAIETSTIGKPETATAVRTLIAAGFDITRSDRHATHIEILCTRPDLFGISVDYLVAVFDEATPPAGEAAKIAQSAKERGRVPVVISASGSDDSLAWEDALASLGGAVPNWRVLGPSYKSDLLTLARNELPNGQTGEAWQLFEDAVADGFEFLHGARVLRLGGKRRNKRVSDMISQLPDQQTLVIDAKAYADPFDVSSGNLRALEDYTAKQMVRQRGSFSVGGAVLVANAFQQDELSLQKYAGDFLAATRSPLTFVTAGTLAGAIEALAKNPVRRAAVQWRQLFCRGGLLNSKLVQSEIADAGAERKSN